MELKKIALASAFALMTGSASAALIPLPTGVTILEDDNIEYVLDSNGNIKTTGTLEVGDRLRAVITFNNVLQADNSIYTPLSGVGGLQLTGISEIQISGFSADGQTVYFAPSASFEATYGTGAMAALYSQDPGTFATSCNAVSVAACETTATNGSLWAVAGFGDVDDFWFATYALPFGTMASITIEQTASLNATTKVATANYGLSLLVNNTGYEFSQQYSAIAGFIPGGDDMVDVIGSGDVLGGAGLGSPFFARSDFDFELVTKPVPEPGVLALLSISLIGLSSFSRRSKTNA